jgi:hypothetical protein
MQVPSVAFSEGVAYRLFIDSLEANEVDDVIEHWCCCLAGSSSTMRSPTAAPSPCSRPWQPRWRQLWRPPIGVGMGLF